MNEDKATRYHRLKRTTGIVALVWSAVLLGGLVVTGASVSLRNIAESAVIRVVPVMARPAVTVIGYVVLLTLVSEIGSLL